MASALLDAVAVAISEACGDGVRDDSADNHDLGASRINLLRQVCPSRVCLSSHAVSLSLSPSLHAPARTRRHITGQIMAKPCTALSCMARYHVQLYCQMHCGQLSVPACKGTCSLLRDCCRLCPCRVSHHTSPHPARLHPGNPTRHSRASLNKRKMARQSKTHTMCV
jgi:hypothetical protein